MSMGWGVNQLWSFSSRFRCSLPFPERPNQLPDKCGQWLKATPVYLNPRHRFADAMKLQWINGRGAGA